MSAHERTFYLFPQLPAELRLAIWRECLPHRVSEIDVPYPDLFYLEYDAPSWCELQRTTYYNGLPPVISRVCRESRAVAFETGIIEVFHEGIPGEAQWDSSNSTNETWLDLARDSVHLHWVPFYEADWISAGSPLHCLAWSTTQVPGGGSLMFHWFLESNYNEIRQMLDAFRRLPSWTVVMHVVVVHADFRTAAATGMFGLLGDACVQIVDASDEARVNAFYDLAEEYERKRPVQLHSQDLRRDTVEAMKKRLRHAIIETFQSEEFVPAMHPAIMFRLCTAVCPGRERLEYSSRLFEYLDGPSSIS